MWSKDDVAAMLINPVYAVSINPDLAGRHEPIVPKERWIEANERLISDIGAEEWLRRLLAVLEGTIRPAQTTQRLPTTTPATSSATGAGRLGTAAMPAASP
jgi:hypothetical protein